MSTQATTLKQSKSVKMAKLSTAFRAWLKFALSKISENVGEMALTLVAAAIAISGTSIVAPQAAIEYSGYIALIFLLLQMRRLVQDFDESWTNDEIAEQLSFMDSKLDNIERMVRDETVLSAAMEEPS